MSTELNRQNVAPAPGGLAFVQQFLNTRGTGSGLADLLDDTSTAAEWFATATGESAELDDRGLRRLRGIRSDLVALVNGGGEAGRLSAQVEVVFDAAATGSLRPVGKGIPGFRSALFAEVLLAQRADEWKRLKTCANPGCGSAFYDRSRNNSGVWHDPRTCGNAANLRASRARRRPAPPVAG